MNTQRRRTQENPSKKLAGCSPPHRSTVPTPAHPRVVCPMGRRLTTRPVPRPLHTPSFRRRRFCEPVACCSPPSLEPGFSLGLCRRDLDGLDSGGSTASVTPFDHRVDGSLGSLEDGLDAPIVEISDPAVDALFGGPVARTGSVVDTLYTATHEDVGTNTV